MNFINNTSCPALTFPATDQQGQSSQVVVMRATYEIREDGTLVFSDEQKPLVLTDEYFGEMNKSSVRRESDLVPFKPKCDVIVNATAYAPGGIPSVGFVAGIKIVGPPQENGAVGQLLLEKKLLVTGPRFWEKGLLGGWTLKPPNNPIGSLPLRYEYAFGGECKISLDDTAGKRIKEEFRLNTEQRNCHPDGPDVAPVAHSVCGCNPLGLGFVEEWYLKAKNFKSIPAPQIDDPKNPVRDLGKAYPPQGFGIITKSWNQRLVFAGTYDDAWLETRWPDLPENFDMAYWNGAHPDMQVPYLNGDEEIVLSNLTPGGSLNFRLPGLKPIVKVVCAHGQALSVSANLDTVILKPDSMRIALVWRAVVATQLADLVLEISAG